MHHTTGAGDPAAAFRLQQRIGLVCVTGDGTGIVPVKVPQVVCPAGKFITENNNRIALCQFTGGMHPHVALASGFPAVMDHFHSCFITLVIRAGTDFITQPVINQGKDLVRKVHDPCGHGLA